MSKQSEKIKNLLLTANNVSVENLNEWRGIIDGIEQSITQNSEGRDTNPLIVPHSKIPILSKEDSAIMESHAHDFKYPPISLNDIRNGMLKPESAQHFTELAIVKIGGAITFRRLESSLKFWVASVGINIEIKERTLRTQLTRWKQLGYISAVSNQRAVYSMTKKRQNEILGFNSRNPYLLNETELQNP